MSALENILQEAHPCEFCGQKKDGGIDILQAEADCGLLGTITAGINLYAYQHEPRKHMSLWMWYDGEEESISYSLIEKDFDIKYCPVCGKEL